MTQRRPLLTVVTLAVALAFTPSLSGQSTQTVQVMPAFDVASIKSNRSGPGPRAIGPEPGGRFGALNVGLRELIGFAHGISNADVESRVLGGPEWIRTERFDVAARAADVLPPDQIGPMVRTLLADRFKLRAHDETREVPVYALVLARADGAPGPQLRRSDVDCDARRAAARGGKPLPQPPGGAVCTGRTIPGNVTGSALSIASLAGSLTRFVDRPIVDRTGLAGFYNYELKWTPDRLPESRPGEAPPVIDPDGPPLVTALQEQLGLKLEPQRAAMRVVVIDQVELPTPD
jgi:uncharacterized protein (TIGR03435 family)